MSSVPTQVAENTVDRMNEVLDRRLGTIAGGHVKRFGEAGTDHHDGGLFEEFC